MEPSNLSYSGVSPREQFIGRRLDAKLDFRVGFGDYVQVTQANTGNSMESRTSGCIALYGTGNGQGSIKVYSLGTKKIITRDQFKILPMPDVVIDLLNALAARDGMKRGKDVVVNDWSGVEQEREDELDAEDTGNSAIPTNLNSDKLLRDEIARNIDEEGENHLEYPVMPELRGGGDAVEFRGDEQAGELRGDEQAGELRGAELAGDLRSANQAGGLRGAEEQDVFAPTDIAHEPLDYTGNADQANYFSNEGLVSAHVNEPQAIDLLNEYASGPVAGRTRAAAARLEAATGLFTCQKPIRGKTFLVDRGSGRHMLDDHLTLERKEFTLTIPVKKALAQYGDKATTVINSELSQMIDKSVWTPKLWKQLTAEERKRVIRSSMFLKEKFFSTGEFEKLKARLVAGGHMQDKSLYEDLSSPTAQTSHVFAVAAIAAAEEREVVTLDIGGAYLNASLKDTGIKVHMKLDKVMSGMLVLLKPEYKEFIQADGTMIVLLDKALYGCVESAMLWYNNLRSTLLGLGYVENPHDICVFNKTDKDGTQCTLVLHVDDLLMTSKKSSMIEATVEGLQSRYQNTTVHRGKVHSYLGMTFDFSKKGEVCITMANFVKTMLTLSGIKGTAKTPCKDDVFEINHKSPKASTEDNDWFHSNVAKMLYLSKRARPECLQAVSFLTTRVNCCTAEDIIKLKRLLMYVNGSQDRGVILRPGVGSGSITLSQLIDAAYGLHADRKSHTGSVVVIGKEGCIHVKSSKQKVVTKSSTEAELIGLSDAANIGLHTRNFLLAQGYKLGPLRIYQDNKSCMALMNKGKSTSERSRHVDIRWFWLKERIDNREIELIYLPTSEMYANLLTKPIQGAQFEKERRGLTGM